MPLPKLKTSELFKDVAIFLVILAFSGALWVFRKDLAVLPQLGYLGLFLVNALSYATIILPTPVLVATFLAGSVWNPMLVGLISGLGSAVGDLVGYFLGFGSRRVIAHYEHAHRKLMVIEKWFHKAAFLTIFVASALPDPFFDLVGLASGALRYPVGKFFLAILLGRVVRNLVIAYSGAKIL